MSSRNSIALLAPAVATLTALTLAAAAFAQSPGLGQPLSAADLAGIQGSVLPDGAGLPPGSGSVADGARLYQTLCLSCHGPEGQGGINDRLAGGIGSLTSEQPIKTIGSFWPYATTLFDYLRKAMPYTAPGSLSDEESYALTAYLLHVNGIVDADAVLDAGSLPAVRMPNRDGFTSALD